MGFRRNKLAIITYIQAQTSQLVASKRLDRNRNRSFNKLPLGGLLFGKIGDQSRADPPLPRPPRVPQGRVVRRRDALDIIAPARAVLPALRVPDPHNAYAFYWREGRCESPSDRYSLECDLFRHGGHEELIELPFFLPRKAKMRDALDIIAPARAVLPALRVHCPHNHYAFYWREGRCESPSDRYSLECDLFRHGGHEELIELPFFLPRKAKMRDGIIEVEVFARNLSRAVTMK